MSDSAPTPQRRRRSGAVAAFVSSLLPGLGHLYLGDRQTGRLLLLVNALLISAVAVSLWLIGSDFLKLWVSPDWLALLMAFNLCFLLYRILASSHAYWVAREGPHRRRASPTAFSLVVIGLVLVSPHLALGQVVLTQYSLIETVFADGSATRIREAASVPVPNPVDGEPLPGVVDQIETPSTAADPTTTTTEPTTTTSEGESPLWDGRERLNLLLLGADAGEGRRGLRTDTSILVSVDPDSGETTMISVPRDLSGAPLPTEMGIWGCDCFPDLITHLYDAGIKHPEAFPGPQEPPINGLKAAFGEIFGVEVHYYAMVTLEGFVDIVDALGGVTIEVPRTIRDETYPHENGTTVSIEIPEGTRQLNGHEALAYARIRRYSDDFSRMHRQRCVLEALVEQTNPAEILLRFSTIADALERSLDTDIPQSLLPDFIDLLPKVSTDRVSTLRITRDVYKIGSGPGRTYYDIDRIRTDTQSLLSDPAAARAELGLQDLDGTCGVVG